jgi:hypothetical protein
MTFSLASEKKGKRQGASAAAQWNVIHAKGLDDPIHMHPLDFIPFQTSSSQKRKGSRHIQ